MSAQQHCTRWQSGIIQCWMRSPATHMSMFMNMSCTMFHGALSFSDRSCQPVLHLPRQVKSSATAPRRVTSKTTASQQEHSQTPTAPQQERAAAAAAASGGQRRRRRPAAASGGALRHTAPNSGALPPLSQPHESSSGLDVTSRLKSSSAEGRCAGSAVSVALTRLTRMRRKEQRVLLGGGEL